MIPRFQCMNGDCNYVFDSLDTEGQLTRCPACGVSQKAVKAFDGVTPLQSTIAGNTGKESIPGQQGNDNV